MAQTTSTAAAANPLPTFVLLDQFATEWLSEEKLESTPALVLWLRVCTTMRALEAQHQGRPTAAEVQIVKSAGPKLDGAHATKMLTVAAFCLEYILSQSSTSAPWKLASLTVSSGGAPPSGEAYPCFPLVLCVLHPKAATLCLAPGTKAQELVERLGEPFKKGGGELARAGPGAWLEWRMTVQHRDAQFALDLHVSLQGPGSRGQQRWDKGQANECTWESITLNACPAPYT